jgi:hypothetical protein
LAELTPPPPGRTGWPWTEETPPLPKATPVGSSWPSVSIVTPSYNQAQFIEETIRSVLLQGYPNLEYIIIDGGSTDGSVEILSKYEPWLAFWVSEPDRGQSHAINKGWARARGEVLAYLNSDDLLVPDTLTRVAETFVAHPDVAVVYGDCDLIDGEGRLMERLCSRSYSRAGLLLANYIQQSSAFVRRCAVERVGPVDESFDMTMDYEYWVRLAMASCCMTYVPEVLSSARLTSGTKTKSLTLRFLGDTLRVLDAVYSQVDIPDDLHRIRREAYGNAWRLGGVRLFDAGMRGLAVRAMLTSLRWCPFPGWRPLAIAMLVGLQAALGVRWRSAHTVEKTRPSTQ